MGRGTEREENRDGAGDSRWRDLATEMRAVV